MKFPVTTEFRGQRARIYAPAKGFDYYRVSFTIAGRRRMLTFGSYSEAKAAAEEKLRELHKGQQSAALTTKESQDALAIRDALHAYRRDTGRTVTAIQVVNEGLDALRRLGGRTMSEAVEGYLRGVANVKRKDLSEAVEEFLAAEDPRTKAADGQRAQLSPKYAYNRAIMLRRFAGAFENTALCDLSKEHLDLFTGSKPVKEFSAKSRNHHRAAIRQFLRWAVRKDYLPVAHRLNEADGMRPEHANTSEVQTYTPREFRALLEAADGALRAMIAIGGLAGLRAAEVLRLDWADVWRVPGHIEVTARKSKTRARRLVEICPALAAWLEPFRQFKSGPVWDGAEITYQQNALKLCEAAGVPRKANGLRHSFCTAAYTLHGENWTAQQAGNSPAMIHQHYKGLATRQEAQAWFAVKPAKAAKNIVPLTMEQATACR